MEHETFFTLLHDKAHWQFELFLIFLDQIVLGILILPFLRNFKSKIYKNDPHHKSDDKKIEELEKQVKKLQEEKQDKLFPGTLPLN